MAKPPRSVAAKPPSAPESLPIGVRAPATITEPAIVAIPHGSGRLERTRHYRLGVNPPKSRPRRAVVASPGGVPGLPPSTFPRHAGHPRSHPGGRFGRRDRRAAHPRELPGGPRAARRAGHVGGRAVRGQGSAQVAAHRRRAHPRARARRGLPRRHGQLDQLQHGVDVDLRAAVDVRLPRPAGPRVGVGRAPRAGLPRRRLRRLGRRPAGRLGRPQLEAGRPRRGPLQLRRRPGSVGPRRLDARRQPAHLGLRVQLRWPRRPLDRQGQPAHAQALAPHVGGGGGQRPVRLDQLPHARRPPRRPHEAGRQRVHLGRHRRHRRLRHAARRSTAAARPIGVVSSDDRVTPAQRHGLRQRRSTARPRATGSGPTSTPRTRASGAASARRCARSWARTPTSCSSTRAARRWAPRCSSPSGAAPSSRAPPPAAS